MRSKHLIQFGAVWPFGVTSGNPVNSLVCDNIQKTAACPILDLDDPEIRIEIDLAAQSFFSLQRIENSTLIQGREQSVCILREFALRRWTVKQSAPVEPIDLDKDSASFLRPTPPQDGVSAFNHTAPQISRNPEIASQARQKFNPYQFIKTVIRMSPGAV